MRLRCASAKTRRGNVNGARTSAASRRRHGTHSRATKSSGTGCARTARSPCCWLQAGLNFDTAVAVHPGRRLALALREVDFNGDGCGPTSPGAAGASPPGERAHAHIAVVGFAASGRFTLTVDRIFTPPNDDLVDAVGITPGSQLSASTRGVRGKLPGNPLTRTTLRTDLVQAEGHYADRHPSAAVYLAVSVTEGVHRIERQLASRRSLASKAAVTSRSTATPGTTYRIWAEDGGSGGSFRLESDLPLDDERRARGARHEGRSPGWPRSSFSVIDRVSGVTAVSAYEYTFGWAKDTPRPTGVGGLKIISAAQPRAANAEPRAPE